MRDLVINFWVWWYMVQVPAMGRQLLGRVIFTLEYTNTLTMARNLTTPLFQDDSQIGKLLSLLIRLVWVWIGGMFSVVIALPLVVAWVVFVCLPLIVIGQLVFWLMATYL